MAVRELIKRDIELLPDEALEDLRKYVQMQKFYFDAFGNDTDYLNSISGMADKNRISQQQTVLDVLSSLASIDKEDFTPEDLESFKRLDRGDFKLKFEERLS